MDYGAGGAQFPPPYNTNGPSGVGDFEVYLQGKINIPSAGTYSFGIYSDDSSFMFIDGVQIATGAVNFGTGSRALIAGLHDIVITMNEGGGGFGLQADAFPGAVAHCNQQSMPNSILIVRLAA